MVAVHSCPADYQIRKMIRQELDIVIDWASEEGWNPGLHDADMFYQTDPNGFLIGTIDGKPVASISVVAYDDTFGFLGFYIVRPEFRGKGYGLQIWNRGMEYLKNRNVGLDGVVAQQENYKKSGFKLVYRNVRYGGIVEGCIPKGVVKLSEVPFGKVLEYDKAVFPAGRLQFLKKWIKQPEGAAYGSFKDGKFAGFGVIRKCRKGFKIGPLNADDEKIAEDLFQALTSYAGDEPVYLDAPEVNPAAIALAEKHNMSVVFETARMYTKEKPNLKVDKIFGVTTLELG